MSSKEGRQSPTPEESSGAQQNDIPGTGQSVNKDSNNKEESKSQLDDLSSNPKPILEDHTKATTSKTTDPSQSSK